MKWTRTTTDEDIIEQVRRYERNRGRIGAFLIVVGALSASVGAGWVLWVEREWRSTTVALTGAGDDSIANAVDGTTFYVGVATGWLCGLLFASGVLAVGQGIGTGFRRDRRNELLLKCWDGGAGATGE